MEIIPFGGVLRRHWTRKRGYTYSRLSPKQKKIQVLKIGDSGNSKKRPLRFRLARKLRLVRLTSPFKLWSHFKNGYVNMMLRLASSSRSNNSGNMFGTKRIPKSREEGRVDYSRTDFENRLIFEIYKSMVASYELGYHK